VTLSRPEAVSPARGGSGSHRAGYERVPETGDWWQLRLLGWMRQGGCREPHRVSAHAQRGLRVPLDAKDRMARDGSRESRVAGADRSQESWGGAGGSQERWRRRITRETVRFLTKMLRI
jgi:hypothetical protein